MSEVVLLGRGKEITSIAREAWEGKLAGAPARISERLAFMSAEHHLVRNFVVRELPRLARPMSLRHIATSLNLSLERVFAIVDELETNLFFLVRDGNNEVSWAFPGTVTETGHHLFFSTGERLDAA